MRDQIINYLVEGLKTIKVNPKQYLIELESERVSSKEIRNLLQSSDIKLIDCLSFGMKDVGDFVQNLDETQIQ
jgi:hypothetical protein